MANDSSWSLASILGVRDVRAAAEFYRDVLGFALDPEHGIFEGVGDEPAVYAIVHRAGAQVHFQIRRGEIPARARESIERDVYVYVDDVEALCAELRDRGAPLAGAPVTAPYGVREIEIEDPFGFRVTFGQVIAQGS